MTAGAAIGCPATDCAEFRLNRDGLRPALGWSAGRGDRQSKIPQKGSTACPGRPCHHTTTHARPLLANPSLLKRCLAFNQRSVAFYTRACLLSFFAHTSPLACEPQHSQPTREEASERATANCAALRSTELQLACNHLHCHRLHCHGLYRNWLGSNLRLCN